MYLCMNVPMQFTNFSFDNFQSYVTFLSKQMRERNWRWRTEIDHRKETMGRENDESQRMRTTFIHTQTSIRKKQIRTVNAIYIKTTKIFCSQTKTRIPIITRIVQYVS